MLLCIPVGSLDAVIALSLKPFMDAVMLEKAASTQWMILFAIVGFTFIQGALSFLAVYLNTWVGGRITNDLKGKLYDKLLSFETSYFDKRNSGEILYRFNGDADTASAGLLNNVRTLASRLFSSIALIGVLFYNSWQLSLLAIVFLLFALFPIVKIRKYIADITHQNVIAGSAIMTEFNESFSGNKTIASYNLSDFQKAKFGGILGTIFGLRIKMVQKTGWLSPMMHVTIAVGIGVAIGYGSHLIMSGQMTAGNFVSFLTAMIMLYTPVRNLGNNYNAVQISLLAIERVFEILDSQPTIADRENAVELTGVKENIVFENVRFSYTEDKAVLQNISLTVQRGETIALVGPSGGGKTTFVNLVPRFYDVDSGSIKIDGIDVRDCTLKSLRENVAVVFQDNFLFSGTIGENILLGMPDATEAEIAQALKMAYLDEFIAELQDGIDTYIGERGILLSGGQKQRVAIARAFIKNAPIIILDEATSALDNRSEAIVQKAIDNLMHDKTVFVIAHRLSTIQNADRIAVINDGQLVEFGTHQELLAIPSGQYRHLYEMQFSRAD